MWLVIFCVIIIKGGIKVINMYSCIVKNIRVNWYVYKDFGFCLIVGFDCIIFFDLVVFILGVFCWWWMLKIWIVINIYEIDIIRIFVLWKSFINIIFFLFSICVLLLIFLYMYLVIFFLYILIILKVNRIGMLLMKLNIFVFVMKIYKWKVLILWLIIW